LASTNQCDLFSSHYIFYLVNEKPLVDGFN